MSEQLKLDPLYTIFEKHLYDFQASEENELELIDKIVNDYLKFLAENKVTVPRKWQASIVEELRDQVRQMLVKKAYGALSVTEFVLGERRKKDFAGRRKRARKRYSGLY